MPKVRITYIMSKYGEDAETCIDLHVTETVAESLTRYQRESLFVRFAGRRREIAKLLKTLAELQGYKDAEFEMAELLENE